MRQDRARWRRKGCGEAGRARKRQSRRWRSRVRHQASQLGGGSFCRIRLCEGTVNVLHVLEHLGGEMHGWECGWDGTEAAESARAVARSPPGLTARWWQLLSKLTVRRDCIFPTSAGGSGSEGIEVRLLLLLSRVRRRARVGRRACCRRAQTAEIELVADVLYCHRKRLSCKNLARLNTVGD